jgi:hypothetical protein
MGHPSNANRAYFVTKNELRANIIKMLDAPTTNPAPTIWRREVPRPSRPDTKAIKHAITAAVARARNFQYSAGCTGGIYAHIVNQIKTMIVLIKALLNPITVAWRDLGSNEL